MKIPTLIPSQCTCKRGHLSPITRWRIDRGSREFRCSYTYTLCRGYIVDCCVTSISFKRKQKRPARFSLSNLFSEDTASSFSRHARTGSQRAGDRPHGERQDYTGPYGNSNGDLDGFKDGAALDWYVEGPGRRVGYDDLTAIDWIFEYTKERQRKRLLYSTGQGILGHVRQLLDASHVWLVLIATGIAVGVLAASIDIASNWLGDIKTGYCKNGRGGGKFYLNKSFCCWGHEGNSNGFALLLR